MFGTIRKHQSWLWALIIAAMIIGLVAFFNPAASSSRGRGGATLGLIDGQSISEEDYVNAAREVNLQFFLRYGSWPDVDAKRMGFDEQRETYLQLFLVKKLKDYEIQVDPAAVAKTANLILNNIGRGNPVSLDDLVQKVLAPHGMSADDFERFVRHELGREQLFAVIGTSGKLVTPAEAESLYVREKQEISASAVFFSASNYLASVGQITPQMVAQFYTNQMAAYRLPDRMTVSYVKFDVTNFLGEADQQIAKMTNFNALVDQVYRQRGTNYYKVSTPDEAKAKIREEVRRKFASDAALKKANDFATDLFNMQPVRPENLMALAKSNGLTAKISEPFSADFPPDEIGPVKNFTETAFALTPDDPFTQPLVGGDSVVVAALGKKIPSEVPPLETIRARVEHDLKMTEALMLARRNGMQFSNALTNGLATGKTFAGICTDSKVKPVMLPPFSLGTQDLPELDEQISLNQLKQIAFNTASGKSSGFIPTREGGLVLYVKERLPLDQARMREDMPTFINAVRQTRENEAINLWYSREATKSLRDTPLGQPKSSAMGPKS
jgi:hypothetical protein